MYIRWLVDDVHQMIGGWCMSDDWWMMYVRWLVDDVCQMIDRCMMYARWLVDDVHQMIGGWCTSDDSWMMYVRWLVDDVCQMIGGWCTLFGIVRDNVTQLPVHSHSCMHMHTRAHMRMRMHACTHARTHAHTHTHTHTHTYLPKYSQAQLFIIKLLQTMSSGTPGVVKAGDSQQQALTTGYLTYVHELDTGEHWDHSTWQLSLRLSPDVTCLSLSHCWPQLPQLSLVSAVHLH